MNDLTLGLVGQEMLDLKETGKLETDRICPVRYKTLNWLTWRMAGNAINSLTPFHSLIPGPVSPCTLCLLDLLVCRHGGLLDYPKVVVESAHQISRKWDLCLAKLSYIQVQDDK